MNKLEKMYLLLFNRITDALRAPDEQEPGVAAAIRRRAQAESEELYISGE